MSLWLHLKQITGNLFLISQLPLFFFLTFHVISPLIAPSCSSYTLINHLHFFFLSLCFSPVPMGLRARLSRLSPTWTPWRSPSSRPAARWKVCVVRSADRARWVWPPFSEDSWMTRQHVIYYTVQICAKVNVIQIFVLLLTRRARWNVESFGFVSTIHLVKKRL